MSNIQDITVNGNLLRGFSFFEGLDDNSLSKIAILATELNIPADTELLSEGEQSDQLYLLVDGRISISVSIPGRAPNETMVSTVSRGQLLGWSALLPQGHWTASAYSLKPCRLISISGEELQELCCQDNTIGYHLMKNALASIGARLADCRLQLIDIFGVVDA